MAPLLVGANDEQLQKYLGRLIEEPMMAVKQYACLLHMGERRRREGRGGERGGGEERRGGRGEERGEGRRGEGAFKGHFYILYIPGLYKLNKIS